MARKELKRRPQKYEEVKGVGPKRAKELRDELGPLSQLRGSTTYLKNRLGGMTSGRSTDRPEFARNLIISVKKGENQAVDAVDSSLVREIETDTSITGKSRSQRRKGRVREGEAETEGTLSRVGEFDTALEAFSEEYQGTNTFTGPDPREIKEGVEESAAPDEFTSVLPSAVNQRTFLQFPNEQNFEENVEKQAGSEGAIEPAKEGFVTYVDQTIGLGGGMRTIGEFEVSSDEYEEAQEEFSQQSPEAQRVDNRRRAPITTNEDKYAKAPGRLDFPGVDTPNEDPQVKQKDSQTVDAEETTLDQREGSLFIRDNTHTGGVTPSLKGVFSSARSPDSGTTRPAAELAAEQIGANVDEDSGGAAVADIMFLERDKDGFGEELIPFAASESDKRSFDF